MPPPSSSKGLVVGTYSGIEHPVDQERDQSIHCYAQHIIAFILLLCSVPLREAGHGQHAI